MVNERIILYLGFHETAEDAQDAINTIKKTTEHLKNNTIMIIEKAGWIDGHYTKYDSDNMNEAELNNFLEECENIYQKWIYKIKNGIPLDEDEKNWPTTLFKFGYENNYMPFFEIINHEITKKLMSSKIINDNENQFVQRERDEFLIKNQIIPLMKKYPDKTCIIIWGLGHKKIIGELLKKLNISYIIYEYGITTLEEADREAEKLLRKLRKGNKHA